MDLTQVIGLGVAGNFAGHLEQAGEANDFKNVEVKESSQPKAIFPFYVPANGDSFLNTFPLSHNSIALPDSNSKVQIEPEIALYCKIHYENNNVARLEPLKFGAYNDCSIRRPNAKKISEKKNWGANTKGISSNLIDLDHFSEGGIMDHYRIACFLKRDGEYINYGIDSAAKSYSYFHEKLLEWIADRMNHQADEGPMNAIADLLAKANHPQYALIGIGATRYTEFGEQNFLKAGDQSVVVVYNGAAYSADTIVEVLEKGIIDNNNLSVLAQTVR